MRLDPVGVTKKFNGAKHGSTLLVHNCRVAQGSSGAPLLMMEGGVAAIVGIQVAIGSRNGANIMLAVSLPNITRNLLDKPRM